MKIILIISNHCDSCRRAVEKLKRIENIRPDIKTEILNINSYSDTQILVTPALIVNGELFSYGDIDENKLLAELN